MVDFPRHMSRSAISLIKRLCRDGPTERLGYQKGGIQDIKKHKWVKHDGLFAFLNFKHFFFYLTYRWFQGFDWDGLANQRLEPPIFHPVRHSLDTAYFDVFPRDTEVPPDELSGWDAEFWSSKKKWD